MADLQTEYLGLKLKNPIIAGSSNLSGNSESIKKLEDAGAGAVVLKSIFEEQILRESGNLTGEFFDHAEEYDYISQYTRQFNVEKYLALIKEAKKSVNIPIIASINCVSDGEWTTFAKKIEAAGADAIELNIFILPGDFQQAGNDIENIYFKIIDAVKKAVKIPISIKVSHYFSGLANMIFRLSLTGIKGIVLFNRFYSPDIDLEKMELISSDIYSSQRENSLVLRWIGMMSGNVKCDLASSTGIHSGTDVIKNILVGSKAVQVVSALYKSGPGHISVMLKEMDSWLNSHNYNSLNDIRGKLSQEKVANPSIYEQVQFMKYFSV